MSKLFTIGVPQIHIQYYDVEAESEREAVELLKGFLDDGENEEVVAEGTLLYEKTLEKEQWSIQKAWCAYE